ncbi:MAG TPA: sigma 54-interacting transcriptional regulator, partial [Candidatus Aminicenantes bacterium]|nr:sigma 54-interacting transcriptional regulator [Candidatus Aminicenantes bacterium]
NTEKSVDVRVVAATNHNLGERIEAGLFREDLYYRLNVLQIDLPPLRHRSEDIPLLFNHFLELQNRKQNKNVSGAEPKLMEIFYNYRWPGNVRQMEHIVERLVVLSEGDQLTTDLLPPDFLREYGRQESFQPGLLKEGFSLTDYLDGLTREIILKALAQSGNNRRETARSLGLSYRSLRYYIEKYGLRE